MTAPGGECVYLDTEAMQGQLQQIAQTGQQLTSAWQGSGQAIAAGDAALGTGPIAEAFRAPYTATAQPLRTAADRVPGLHQQLAEVGQACAEDYVQRDAGAASAMPTAPAVKGPS